MENEQQPTAAAEQEAPAMYQSLDGEDAATADTEADPEDDLFHPRMGGRYFFEPQDWDLD